MPDVEVLNNILRETVPFSRVLEVQVTAVDEERAEALLPAAPERLNHVGTVHAVAQFGLGETTAGILIVSAFGDLQAEGIVPVIADVVIHYRKSARGDLHSSATLARTEHAGIRAEARATGRASVTIPVMLCDAEDNVVTEFEMHWVLLKPRG